jgi:hypothetical protein
MSYYPTIEEDLKRVAEILAKGDARREFVTDFPNLTESDRDNLMRMAGGTIYGADTYAAYKLLESLSEEVRRLQQMRMAARSLAELAHWKAVGASPLFSVEHWSHNAGPDWPHEPDDDSYIAFENCQHLACRMVRS